jgi:hypothetical protein
MLVPLLPSFVLLICLKSGIKMGLYLQEIYWEEGTKEGGEIFQNTIHVWHLWEKRSKEWKLGKRCLELQQSAKNGSVRPMWTPQVKACYRRSPAFLKNCLAFVFLRCLFFDLEEFTGSIASLRMHWWKTQRGWSWSHQLIMLPVQNIGVACVHGW